MLLSLLLGLLIQDPQGIMLNGPSVLLASETKAVVTIRAGEQALRGSLRLWLPPDLQVRGLDLEVDLSAGQEISSEVVLVVEEQRPAAVLAWSVELVDAQGARIAKQEQQLWSALGRDFIRMTFETRGGLPGVAGDLAASLIDDQPAFGSRSLRLRVAAGASGSVTLWASERGEAPIGHFPYLTFYLRTVDCEGLELQFLAGESRQTVALIGGDDALLAASRTQGWQRVVIPITAELAVGMQAIQLAVHGGSEGAQVDLDEFALSRSAEVTLGDRLRNLTERYVGALPTMEDQIVSLQLDLKEISIEELAPQGRIDHSLLQHALALRAEELRSKPRETGVPTDAEHFAALLSHRHHLAITAEEVRTLGLTEVRRHQSLLTALAEEISPGKSWRQVVELLRQRHPTAEQLPGFAEQAMQSAIEFSVLRALVTVPMAARTASIEVVTDGRRSRTYPFGGYGGARRTADGYLGIYFVSPPAKWMDAAQSLDRLRGNHRAWTRVVALHEIVPGHHLQTVVHRMRPLSPFRRQFYSTVFAEGWALYCEEMLYREGFFPDADTRFTQLHMRLWRAARMVIDASLHTRKMSLSKAQAYLVDEVAFDVTNARAEVLRYVDNPSRPMSYMLGYVMITQLIEDAKTAAGEGFRIAAFRDRLLSFGPIPIPAIRLGLGL